MQDIFNKLKGLENLKSFEIDALNKFINLEPMNKANFTHVMCHVNDLVNRLSTTHTIINKARSKEISYYDFLRKNSVIHKDGFTFLQKIDFEGGERPLKQFKYDNLSDFEKIVYNARKDFLEIKANVKEHAEKLKALIITKQNKVVIEPIKKVFPNALPKESIQAILIDQTNMLLVEFLEKTEKYAKASFDKALTESKLTYQESIEKYKNIKKALSIKNEALSIINKGYDKYLAEELYYAKVHYYQSINKLTYRLYDKGIVESKDFTIITSKIGQNIETTIVDKNGKITKAWTIIASGEIQQPHYRYLVK